MNQAKEIFDYIKLHPGANVQEITNKTGWNRHIVEVVTQMLVQKNLIREVGQTEWADPKYEAVSQPAATEQGPIYSAGCAL